MKISPNDAIIVWWQNHERSTGLGLGANWVNAGTTHCHFIGFVIGVEPKHKKTSFIRAINISTWWWPSLLLLQLWLMTQRWLQSGGPDGRHSYAFINIPLKCKFNRRRFSASSRCWEQSNWFSNKQRKKIQVKSQQNHLPARSEAERKQFVHETLNEFDFSSHLLRSLINSEVWQSTKSRRKTFTIIWAAIHIAKNFLQPRDGETKNRNWKLKLNTKKSFLLRHTIFLCCHSNTVSCCVLFTVKC